jgi:hypothetical protein
LPLALCFRSLFRGLFLGLVGLLIARFWVTPSCASTRSRIWGIGRVHLSEKNFYGLFRSRPLQLFEFGKRHYNSSIRRSAITSSHLSHPCHFLCLPTHVPRIRVHLQCIHLLSLSLMRRPHLSSPSSSPHFPAASSDGRILIFPWRTRTGEEMPELSLSLTLLRRGREPVAL